jgi:hypothetical protein
MTAFWPDSSISSPRSGLVVVTGTGEDLPSVELA